MIQPFEFSPDGRVIAPCIQKIGVLEEQYLNFLQLIVETSQFLRTQQIGKLISCTGQRNIRLRID